MRRLPALQVGPASCPSPIADRSAAVLAEVLLSEPEDQPDSLLMASLTRQVASDPPLAAWITLQAVCRQGCGLGTAGEAAAWLARHMSELLGCEPADGHAGDLISGAEAERWATRVARALQLADLAARLAGREDRAAADAAYFEGLLYDAPSWFDDRTEGGLRELFDLGEAAERSWAARAASILDGQSSPPAPDCDPRACRHRSVEGVRRWLEPVAGAGVCLSALAARLVRLRELEARFQETLETEKLEALAEFAAGAGHEINNPLAIIAGRAQVLLRDEPDPERRRELASINAQARRAHEMIADLRLFARPPRPERRRTDLAALIAEVIAELTPQMAERGVAIARAGRPEPIEADIDPTQMRVVLHALCRNALEAIGRDGRIEISLDDNLETAVFRVIDDGPGIPAEHRRHLFDPFYSSRQAGRGLGLGLSKCWRIVTGHGGRIDVENLPDRGAAITVTLPRRAGRELRR